MTEEHHGVFHVSGTCALGFTPKEEGREEWRGRAEGEGERGKEEEEVRK